MGSQQPQQEHEAATAHADFVANPLAAAKKGDIIGLAADNLRLQSALEALEKRVDQLEKNQS